MLAQSQEHLSVAWPPEILVLLELVVAAIAAIFLVSAMEDRTAKVDQDQDFVPLLNLDCKDAHCLIILWVQVEEIVDFVLEDAKLTITCEVAHDLGHVDGIFIADVDQKGD